MIAIEALSLSGLQRIIPRQFPDERGFFKETYRQTVYAQMGVEVAFVQDNHSFSKRGVIRGMHFQQHPGQVKLVSVISGRIFDVAVDMRKESPSFGKWEGLYLDGETGAQFLIPVGFAHGFCVVSEEAHVIYKVSQPYDPLQEKGFCFDDPEVGIQWPVAMPIVSAKDRQQPRFREVCGR